MDTILHAIQTFSDSSTSNTIRKEAESHIKAAQNSDECIDIAIKLLEIATLSNTHPSYGYFAARMFHEWIGKNVDELADGVSTGQLWTLLLQYLEQQGFYDNVSRAARGLLCRALATVVVVLSNNEHRESTFSQLYDVLQRAPMDENGANIVSSVLCIFSSMPSELDDAPLRRNFRLMCKSSLVHNCDSILNMITTCLSEMHNDDVQLEALRCLEMWLSHTIIPRTNAALPSIVAGVFEMITADTYFEHACAVISAAVQRPSSFVSARSLAAMDDNRLSQVLIEGCLSVRPCYEQVAETHTDKAHALALLVANVAEAQIDDIAHEKCERGMELLDFALLCTSHPEGYVSVATFDFWQRFVEQMAFLDDGVAVDSSLESILMHLLSLVMRQCEPLFESIDDDGSHAFDVWYQHRSDASAMFTSLYECLADRFVLHARDVVCSHDSTWQQMESALFSLLCVARLLCDSPISRDVGGALNDILSTIDALRAEEHCIAALVSTCAKWLGEYTWWPAVCNNTLGAVSCITFVVEFVARVPHNSSLAEQLASQCGEVMECCAEIVTSHSSDILNLLVEVLCAVHYSHRAKVMSACAHLLVSLLAADSETAWPLAIEVLNGMCTRTTELIDAMFDNNAHAHVVEEIACEIDGIATLLRWPLPRRSDATKREIASQLVLQMTENVCSMMSPLWQHAELMKHERLGNAISGCFCASLSSIRNEDASEFLKVLYDRLLEWMGDCICVHWVNLLGACCEKGTHCIENAYHLLRLIVVESDTSVYEMDVCEAIVKALLCFTQGFVDGASVLSGIGSNNDDHEMVMAIINVCNSVLDKENAVKEAVSLLKETFTDFEQMCTIADKVLPSILGAILTTPHSNRVYLLVDFFTYWIQGVCDNKDILQYVHNLMLDESFPDVKISYGVDSVANVFNRTDELRLRMATLLVQPQLCSNVRFYNSLLKDLRAIGSSRQREDVLVSYEEKCIV